MIPCGADALSGNEFSVLGTTLVSDGSVNAVKLSIKKGYVRNVESLAKGALKQFNGKL